MESELVHKIVLFTMRLLKAAESRVGLVKIVPNFNRVVA